MKKRFIFFLFGIFLYSSLHALTINEAVKIALKNNFQIISKKHDIFSAKYKIYSAKALRMPSFFVDSNYTILDDSKKLIISNPFFKQTSTIAEKNYIDFMAGVKLNLYTGGLITGSINAAQNSLNIKKLQMRELKLDIAYNTKIAYLTVLELQAYRKIAEKHLTALLNHLNDVKNFYKQGTVAYIDILQTDVKVKEAQQQLKRIENSIKVAKSNLAIIMGEDPEKNFILNDIKVTLPKKINLQSLYSEASKNRPILKQIDTEIELVKNQIKIKSSEYKPKFFVLGGYKYSDIQDDVENKGNFLFQVGVKFNLDWDKAFKDIDSLKEKNMSLKFTKEDLKSKILLGVKKAYEDYMTSLNNLNVAKSAVKSAKEYFRIIKLKYKNGVADNTDVLDGEAMLTDAMMRERTDYFDVLKKWFLIQRTIGVSTTGGR